MVASAIRRGRRPSIVDAWIAAIARSNGHPVVITRDRGYAGLDGIEVRGIGRQKNALEVPPVVRHTLGGDRASL